MDTNNYRFQSLVLLLVLTLVVSCRPDDGCRIDPNAPKFAAFSPYASISQTDIQYLADTYGLPKSNLEATPITDDASKRTLGNYIMNWQIERMELTDPNTQSDVSYPMRWNYIMPGIYPLQDMIRDRSSDDASVAKLYGVCWDYAAVFSAIAIHYGLVEGSDIRITAWKKYMSDDKPSNQRPGADYGMSPAEYAALANKLEEHDLYFPECQIQDAAVETYIHYRPELFLDGIWVSFDATNPTGQYLTESYSFVGYSDGANTELCTIP
jgi:transglutaminase-like putative cysteine protease